MFLFSDIKDNNKIPPESTDTADLILFLDKLFDSINVIKYSKGLGAKPLKSPMTLTSRHLQMWEEAINIVSDMKFFSIKKQCFINVPSINNLKFSIRGMLHLCKALISEKKFKFVLTGLLNQDTLENFFSYIRSHRVRDTNPNPTHFVSSYKTLIVNNYMAKHSPGSNCRKEPYCEGLDNLREFLTGEVISGVTPLEDSTVTVEIPNSLLWLNKTKVGRCTLKYMSGSLVKMLKKSIKCDDCLKNLTINHNSSDEDFIEARQYERGTLIVPGTLFNYLVSSSLNYLFYCIPRICTEYNLSIILKDILNKRIMFKTINCKIVDHNLGNKLCNLLVRCSIYWWTRSVNKILKGKGSKFTQFVKVCKNKQFIDPIKLRALKIWEKKQKYKIKK